MLNYTITISQHLLPTPASNTLLPISYFQNNTPNTILPTPNTLLPTPYSQYPTPYSQHPTPNTLLPTPYSQHPTPNTLLPTPNTRLPTPYSLLPITCIQLLYPNPTCTKVCLIALHTSYYSDGFGTFTSFNRHPVMMTVSMVFVYGDGY